MNVNGRPVCDGCGVEVGNGSLYAALVVSDVVDGVVENHLFCRDREDPDRPGQYVAGCAGRVKRPEVLAAYLEANPQRDGLPYTAVSTAARPGKPPAEATG